MYGGLISKFGIQSTQAANTSNSSLQPIVLLFIAAAAADVESPAGIAILFIPVLINYAIFAASTPAPPGAQDPFSAQKLAELRKYARYPQGLNQNQLNSFLSINNQDKIKVIE